MPLEVAVGVTDSLWRGGMRGGGVQVGYKAFLEEGQVRKVRQRRLGVRVFWEETGKMDWTF